MGRGPWQQLQCGLDPETQVHRHVQGVEFGDVFIWLLFLGLGVFGGFDGGGKGILP